MPIYTSTPNVSDQDLSTLEELVDGRQHRAVRNYLVQSASARWTAPAEYTTADLPDVRITVERDALGQTTSTQAQHTWPSPELLASRADSTIGRTTTGRFAGLIPTRTEPPSAAPVRVRPRPPQVSSMGTTYLNMRDDAIRQYEAAKAESLQWFKRQVRTNLAGRQSYSRFAWDTPTRAAHSLRERATAKWMGRTVGMLMDKATKSLQWETAIIPEHLYLDLYNHQDRIIRGDLDVEHRVKCACCSTEFVLVRHRATRNRADMKRPAVCPTCQAAGAIEISGRYYRNMEEAKASGARTYKQLHLDGNITEAWSFTDPPLRDPYGYADDAAVGMQTSEGVVWVSKPLAGYHSTEGRQFLEPAEAVRGATYVGTELEWHSGGLTTPELRKRAAHIRYNTKQTVIVERDSSVTGFEAITGYGRPSSLRKALAAVWKGPLETTKGMVTGARTGQHVHTSLSSDDSDTYARLHAIFGTEDWRRWGVAGPNLALAESDYLKLSRRNWNEYAHRAMGTSHRSGLGIRTKTLEFRLFRNPNKLAPAMLNIQWCYALVEFAKAGHTDYADAFATFVSTLPPEDTLELRAWLSVHETHKDHIQWDAKEARPYYGRAKLV